MQVNPIHQFEIRDLWPLIKLGGYQISFTNSALFMFIIVVSVSALLIGATSRRAVVPGRLQSIATLRPLVDLDVRQALGAITTNKRRVLINLRSRQRAGPGDA